MTEQAIKKYTLREKAFGPRLTDDEILAIELRAVTEGWYEVLEALLDSRKLKRSKRFLLAYIRDGLIDVQCFNFPYAVGGVEGRQDVYEDDNPYEGWGRY